MSRTVKGKRPPDFAYWTARPGNKGVYGGTPGSFTKRRTAKAERQQARNSAREATP